MIFNFSDREQIVKLLLSKNANKFLQDNDGNTALHKATQNNHQNIVEIILNSCNAEEQKLLSEIKNKKNISFYDLK